MSQLSWLRKLNIYIWVAWQALKAFVLVYRIGDVPEFVRTLLDLADALAQRTPLGDLRTLGLLLRFKFYSGIALFFLAFGDEAQAGLGPGDLKRVIHYAELSLACHEKVASRSVASRWRWTKKAHAFLRQRSSETSAQVHLLIGALYQRLSVGDISDNHEIAFEHYRTAATILEAEGSMLYYLAAADAWGRLAAAQLTYPVENRTHYAREAARVLLRARELAVPYAVSMEAPPATLLDPKVFRRLPPITKISYALPYFARLSTSRSKTLRTGVLTPLYAGITMPRFMGDIDWQLGKAYQELGEYEKAVEHLTLAINEFALLPDLEPLRAGVEVDKGYALLESRAGDQTANVHLAIESFKSAMAACTVGKSVKRMQEKTYVLALLGDAKAYFALHSLNAIPDEQYKTDLPVLVNQLRVSARSARLLALPQQLQQALYLLGRTYLLQGDPARAYRALALAVRVADRLQRSCRTPRFSRFLVSQRAALDDLLMRLSHGSLTGEHEVRAAKGKKKRHVPADHLFCMAERMRTIFLQTQLSTLDLRPNGATNADVEELFARRRSWHRTEMMLLEREANLVEDPAVLNDLRTRRNILESQYRSELENVKARFGDDHYDPDKPAFSLRLSDLYSTVGDYVIDNKFALVEYHLTSRYLLVFVVLPTQLGSYLVDIPIGELKDIERRWTRGYRSLIASRNRSASPNERPLGPIQWANGYLRQVLERLKKIVEIPSEEIKSWEKRDGTSIQKVVIVPHRFLHLIPLHAIPLSDGVPWGNCVPIEYAPSTASLVQLLRLRSRNTVPDSPDVAESSHKAVVVSYASRSGTQALPFEREEARAVAQASGGQLLEGTAATPTHVREIIQDATYIHFACHGVFDSQSPLNAGLELAGHGDATLQKEHTARLTLGEIIQNVRLSHGPVVVLSACETGLTKVEAIHEEYLGLSTGFLYSGASTVISSLWPIADIGTWLLMRKFTKELAQGTSPAAALRLAQQELRQLSRDCLLQEINQLAARELDGSQRARLIEEGQQVSQSDFPFASPYWWAGFTVNGL